MISIANKFFGIVNFFSWRKIFFLAAIIFFLRQENNACDKKISYSNKKKCFVTVSRKILSASEMISV